MSHDHAAAGEHKPHVLPVRIYVGVWAALLVLTYVTVKISYFDFGVMNIYIAMGIATLKASLVALFFMHLKYDEAFTQVLFVSTLVFLAIFIALTMADTVERGRVDPIERRELEPVPVRPELMQQTEGEPAAGHGDEPDGGH
jgi:cytochrome c oxidase subunit 4